MAENDSKPSEPKDSYDGTGFVEEDISEAFSSGLNDVVTGIKVEQGEPFLGKTTGKPHPIYNLTLTGSTNRTRSMRFRVFRDFHHKEVARSSFKNKAKFPPTYAKSSFGIRMSETQLVKRCEDLDGYLQELYTRRGEWTPKLTRAVTALLQIEKEKLFAPTDGKTASGGGGGVSLVDPEAVLEQWTRVKAQWDLLHSAKAVRRKHPQNRTAKALCALETWITNEISDDGLKRLEKCVRSGLANGDSGLGCYAMQPSDYDDLSPFFDKVVADYHSAHSNQKGGAGGMHKASNHGAKKVHKASNWSVAEAFAKAGVVLPLVVSGAEGPNAERINGVYDYFYSAEDGFVKRAEAEAGAGVKGSVCEARVRFNLKENMWTIGPPASGPADSGTADSGTADSGSEWWCCSAPFYNRARQSTTSGSPAAVKNWFLVETPSLPDPAASASASPPVPPASSPPQPSLLVECGEGFSVKFQETLDLSALVSEPLSIRVRVGRNLKAFPLPGLMTLEERIKFEQTMLGAFQLLIEDPNFGGTVHSLTPQKEWASVTGGGAVNPYFIDDKEYAKLVKDHVMFKDMSDDKYLASAGIARDWPCGRGCYVSEDDGFIIWFGEEDHLRIMCTGKGFVLNDDFNRLRKALETLESMPGIEFATSTKYGFVTSCPSNLGTGMRASVHLKLPNLTSDGTDFAKAKAAAKPLGLSVRGIGGEHTPIGADGTVDVSPSARLFVTEAEIVTQLFTGVQTLLQKELQAQPLKNSALLFLKPHADTAACLTLLKEHLEVCELAVVAEGKLTGDEINAKQLIDVHYYAIASKATILKPHELNVPTDKFEAKFGLSWAAALAGGRVFNALDACAELGLSADEMAEQWEGCKQANKLVKFGGGFYCGLLDKVQLQGQLQPPTFVFNGFFMAMRAKYTAPEASVSWLVVEWEAKRLSWKDFRGKLLGPTDPSDASPHSLRGSVAKGWVDLGLPSAPSVGDNGVHGSASPFEAMAERLNWCKDALGLSKKKKLKKTPPSAEQEQAMDGQEGDKQVVDLDLEEEDSVDVVDVGADSFGSELISHGVPEATILAWLKDPQVPLGDGSSGSLFDALEDLDAQACVDECVTLYQAASALEGSVVLHMRFGAYAWSESKVHCGDGVRYAIFPSAEDSEAVSLNPKHASTAMTSFKAKSADGAGSKKPRRILKTVRRMAGSGKLGEKVRTAAMALALSEAHAYKIKMKLVGVVEEVVDRRGGDTDDDDAQRLEYLVKWEGRGFEDMTWVPASSDAIARSSDARAVAQAFDSLREKEGEAREVAAEAFRHSTSQSAADDDDDNRSSEATKTGDKDAISEEFKEAVENGLKLVKFNRKGQAAFRTLYMQSADDTLLHWKPTAKAGITARMVRSTFKAETVDLRTLKSVRLGEAPDPEAEGKWGTPTLRMYVSKNSHGVKMLRGGITFALVFKDRSLDFGADSTAQRDFLVKGFQQLHAKVSNGGIAEGNEAEDE